MKQEIGKTTLTYNGETIIKRNVINEVEHIYHKEKEY